LWPTDILDLDSVSQEICRSLFSCHEAALDTDDFGDPCVVDQLGTENTGFSGDNHPGPIGRNPNRRGICDDVHLCMMTTDFIPSSRLDGRVVFQKLLPVGEGLFPPTMRLPVMGLALDDDREECLLPLHIDPGVLYIVIVNAIGSMDLYIFRLEAIPKTSIPTTDVSSSPWPPIVAVHEKKVSSGIKEKSSKLATRTGRTLPDCEALLDPSLDVLGLHL